MTSKFQKRDTPDGKYMKLTIHIGTRKTGTTSIQEFLRKNKSVLSSNGTHILDYNSLNQYEFALAADVSHNLRYYVEKLSRTDSYNFSEFSNNFFNKLKQEINSLPPNIDHVVVSAEDCSLLDNISIRYMKEKLDCIFDEIKVIGYFRRQDKYVSSNVTTALRSGFSVDFDNILHTNDINHLYYNKIMNEWAKNFGAENITCRIFEKNKLVEQDLIKDFSLNTNINFSDEIDLTKISNNESIDIITATCIEIYNQTESLLKLDEYFRNKLISSINNSKNIKFLPERQKAIEFQALFTAENREFHENFFKNEQDLLDDSFEEYPPKKYNKEKVNPSSEVLLKLAIERERENIALENKIESLNKSVEF